MPDWLLALTNTNSFYPHHQLILFYSQRTHSTKRLSKFTKSLPYPKPGAQIHTSTYGEHAFNHYTVLPIIKIQIMQLAKELRILRKRYLYSLLSVVFFDDRNYMMEIKIIFSFGFMDLSLKYVCLIQEVVLVCSLIWPANVLLIL